MPGGGRPGIGGPGGVGGAGGIGGRPGVGGGPGISTLPSNRPDIGGRQGIAGRPGSSLLPALGAGAVGAGLANRLGDRPAASLPGLGDQRPGAGNPSVGDRRDSLHDRLTGDDRLQNRDDRQQGRQDTRGDRQDTRGDRQQNRQDTRGDRQENRQDNRGDRQENRQDNRGDRQQNRQENRQDIRNDWQDHRDDIRNDWQDHRDEARDDWQDYFDDHYGMYSDWYGGYAPGYWGQWDHLWDEYPVAAAVGLTWWGANALGYGFGYSDYYNPYYTESMPVYYTEPIVTMPIEPVLETAPAVAQPAAVPGAAPPQPGVSSEGVTKFDEARAAFLEGQYEAALKLTDAAVAQMPRDAVLHEFRSLVLFALKRYAESAATIYAVLDVGPGWDWKTLSGLYPSVDVYTSQLRALEAARDQNPDAADLHFLLGYHYLTCGYSDRALSEFKRASKLQPKDQVATSLAATISPRDAEPAPAPAGASPKAVPPADVLGSWTAKGKGTAKYSLALNKDGSFSWGFTSGKRKQEVKGVHTLEDNVLAMEPDSGGVLLAELTLKQPDTLHFKMIGGKADDPGLDFRREAPKKGK
jgi:tetratricopeptide (TPR) repeat protein